MRNAPGDISGAIKQISGPRWQRPVSPNPVVQSTRASGGFSSITASSQRANAALKAGITVRGSRLPRLLGSK